MSYIIMVIILIILAFLFYKKFNKEIMSPTVITCLIFALSALGAFLGTAEGSWNNVTNIRFDTLYVIILGVFSFGIGELIARKFKFIIRKKENKLDDKKDNISENSLIRIDILKLCIVIAFSLLTMVLLYMNLRKLVGGNSISETINRYKSASVLYSSSALADGIVINSLVLNMLRFCEITCVVYIYILIRNLLKKDKISKNSLYIITILIIMLACLLVGGRTVLLRYFAAGLYIWFILYTKKKELSINKFVKIAIKSILVFIPVCYFLLPLLGGKNNSTFIDYVTFYLGSQIPALDIFMSQPLIPSVHFGQMTFKGIQMFLRKFGLISYWSAYQSEWIYFTDSLYTNVFTCFKPYYQDFGYIGVMICTALIGFIFTKMYLAAKKKENCRYLIFFAFYANDLIDQARIEVFYGAFLSTRTIIYFVSMIIITYFLFGKKKIKSGEI